MTSSTMDLLGNYRYHTLAASFLCYISFRQLKRGRNINPNGLPLPPGPKGYPLIGNLFDMPIYKPWVVCDEWFKTYGDMVYLNVFGQPLLVLDSQQRTTDLLEKRSSNYSDRMSSTMVIELMKWDFSLGNLSYGASDDPYISLAEEVLNGLNEAAIPGAFWVDLFPVLKYVPSWFPGAGFQKKASHWREVNAAVAEVCH